jgi:hypothetical protein
MMGACTFSIVLRLLLSKWTSTYVEVGELELGELARSTRTNHCVERRIEKSNNQKEQPQPQ